MNGEGGTSSLAKKSYSVEDITAALDDMVENNEYLNEKVPAARAPPTKPRSESAAKDELDALSKALLGFPGDADEDG